MDYRLAPEHKWPAAVDDCWAALVWLTANGDELNLDTGRVAVGGDSAGGTLAAVVACRARDKQGPPLAMQLLIYPGTDICGHHASIDTYGEGMLLTKAAIRWFCEHYVPEGVSLQHPEVAPLYRESLDGLPAALVITAEFDPLVDEGEQYAMRLAEAGVPMTLTRYQGMIHAFMQFGPAVDAARSAIRQVAQVLAEALA